MSDYIGGSIYPDVDESPAELATDADKTDYVQRVCAAWNFDIYPVPLSRRYPLAGFAASVRILAPGLRSLQPLE